MIHLICTGQVSGLSTNGFYTAHEYPAWRSLVGYVIMRSWRNVSLIYLLLSVSSRSAIEGFDCLRSLCSCWFILDVMVMMMRELLLIIGYNIISMLKILLLESLSSRTWVWSRYLLLDLWRGARIRMRLQRLINILSWVHTPMTLILLNKVLENANVIIAIGGALI